MRIFHVHNPIFATRLREALNKPQHNALDFKPIHADFGKTNRLHAPVISWHSFDAFLDAQASKRRVS
jgi:hypothetical protein